MASPTFYQTLSQVGVDPTIYYPNLSTAGGSITPELPAPPFLPGTRAFGSDGSEFIFVQAQSAAINLGDFVIIQYYSSTGTGGSATSPFTAAGVTTTNAQSSTCIGLGQTGIVLKASVTQIPANAMFWACTKGCFVQAFTQGNQSGFNAAGPVPALYTTATAGQMTATAATTAVAFAGITIISSVSTSLQFSVIPAGLGITSSTAPNPLLGPFVSLNNVRTVNTGSSTAGSTLAAWF